MSLTKIIIRLLVLLIVVFIINEFSRSDISKKETKIEKKQFNELLSSLEGKLLENVAEYSNGIPVSNIEKKRTVLVIEKDINDFVPYTRINNLIKKAGYNISYNKNELDYLIIIKRTKTKVGEYTGGYSAYDDDTEIFVYDMNSEYFSLVYSKHTNCPKNITLASDAVAKGIGGFKLRDFIINMFILNQ